MSTLIPLIIISVIYFITMGMLIKVKLDHPFIEDLPFLMILLTITYVTIIILSFKTELLSIFK